MLVSSSSGFLLSRFSPARKQPRPRAQNTPACRKPGLGFWRQRGRGCPRQAGSQALHLLYGFIHQSRSRPAIYGLQQLKKQRFSPSAAVHGGKMDKPAAAGPLKAKFFLGGQHQIPAAAPSKLPSAWRTRSKAAWIPRGVTPAIGPKQD